MPDSSQLEGRLLSLSIQLSRESAPWMQRVQMPAPEAYPSIIRAATQDYQGGALLVGTEEAVRSQGDAEPWAMKG